MSDSEDVPTTEPKLESESDSESKSGPVPVPISKSRGVKRKAPSVFKTADTLVIDLSQRQVRPSTKYIRFVCPVLGLAVSKSTTGWIAHGLSSQTAFKAAFKAINRNKSRTETPEDTEKASKDLEKKWQTYEPSRNRINIDKAPIFGAVDRNVQYLDCDTGTTINLILKNPLFEMGIQFARIFIYDGDTGEQLP
jgi:hypothetical protein